MIFLRLLKESVLFALNALVVNKLRTFLSLLGITIGIFAIISVFTVVDALENNLRSSIESLGNNVVFIQKWPWSGDGFDYPWWKYLNRPQPSVAELDEIQRKCKGAEACAYTVSLKKTIQYQNNSVEGVGVTGASSQYDKVKNFELARGRYFSDNESASGKNIVIIGDAVAKAFFSDRDPLGETIKIFGRNILIIGVFKREGESIMGGSLDAQVLLPVNFIRNVTNLRSDNIEPTIMVKAKTGMTADDLIDELMGVMRSVRKLKPLAEENFALNQTSVISKEFDGFFGVVGTIGWVIGGFSILVGGFGIANIMFVSVKERTSQIGIQKSLGAKNYFILFQFLAEAVVLSLIGGLIGLLMIYIGTLLIGDSFDMKVTLTRSNTILALTISILIGIISGFIPSYSASQMDPVEAIRTN